MAKFRPLSQNLGVTTQFADEDGKHYRVHTQDMDPVIRKAEKLREMNEQGVIANPNRWRSEGVIPMAMIVDFCRRHGCTMDQWARNEGGEPRIYTWNYHRDPGLKAKFFREFFTRENSKLHSQHITTKTESSQIFTGD